MCAINGFNFKDPELIKAMNALTGHRGPDATRVYEGRGITLGHNRLSIIDISDQSAQPMKNTKGNLAIVFNGEIYNFQELRKELAGYPFKSSGDTEVILAAYEKWGKECVKKFNGIFAFAIWDEERQELFVARDPMGVKPLYYSWDNGRFVFSSEIKAISEHRDMRRLNRDAFNRYLRVLYVPEPLTMIEGIYKLPAASYGAVTNGKLSIERYWQPGPPEYLRLSREELAGMVRKEVTSSVKRQMISDRPLGVYLSGGIDSSVVLHSMSELRKDIDTFSVGFEL
ncbi:MAG TPA: asparagine synthase (glutamine-hydrolyzing), partial [Candidatus Paceibacterota bacterium]|nr:asparagine synthase (glutamine-hydrolyzing) [Candidatus Paceibacterota bacterium]